MADKSRETKPDDIGKDITPINTGGGAFIGGDVTTSGSSFVGRDKTIIPGERGVIIGGDVSGSVIITGDGNVIGTASARARLFEMVYHAIETRSNTSAADKVDLGAEVQEFQSETEKGDQADEFFLARRLRIVRRLAPDIAELMLRILDDPAAGFAAVVRKAKEHLEP